MRIYTMHRRSWSREKFIERSPTFRGQILRAISARWWCARAFATPAAQRVLAARGRFRKTRLHERIQIKVGVLRRNALLACIPQQNDSERFRSCPRTCATTPGTIRLGHCVPTAEQKPEVERNGIGTR